MKSGTSYLRAMTSYHLMNVLQMLVEHKRKLGKLAEEQEDVEISREELDEKVVELEQAVGLQ